MNCIIIDDDPLMQALLKSFVGKSNLLVCKGSYNNPVQAEKCIETENIDLIFLDIEMPEMSGFDFLDNSNKLKQVIVISGNDKYALNTFEYGVADYLLKPFTYERFIKSITKTIDKYIENNSCKYENYVYLKNNNLYSKLIINEITYISFYDKQVKIETVDKEFIYEKKDIKIGDIILSDVFARANSNEIININSVKNLGNDIVEIFSNGKDKKIEIEEEFSENLKQKIKTK